ncbi:hypothetical protein D3C76_645330 [compost metagenome]
MPVSPGDLQSGLPMVSRTRIHHEHSNHSPERARHPIPHFPVPGRLRCDEQRAGLLRRLCRAAHRRPWRPGRPRPDLHHRPWQRNLCRGRAIPGTYGGRPDPRRHRRRHGRLLAQLHRGRQPTALAGPGKRRDPPGHRGHRQRHLGPVGQARRQTGVEVAGRHDPGATGTLPGLQLRHRRAHPRGGHCPAAPPSAGQSPTRGANAQ